MAEVAKQIGPLALQVGSLKETVRSLYRNGDRGAPGYLETAREIDNGRFNELFATLNEFRDDIQRFNEFMRDHLATEKQKAIDDANKEKALAEKVDESERRFKRWLALATLFLGAVTFLMNIRGCSAVKALLSDNTTQSIQDVKIPPLAR